MKRYGNPDIVVTDKCPSYRAAMKVIGNEGRQETGRHLNNRAEGIVSGTGLEPTDPGVYP
jgi:putative transposase